MGSLALSAVTSLWLREIARRAYDRHPIPRATAGRLIERQIQFKSRSSSGEQLSVGASSRMGSKCPATCREHDDNCADLDPIVEVDDVLIGHADAARRDGLADIF